MSLFFALFGIERRYSTTLEILPNKNRSVNRYIEHQILRLGKCRDTGNARLYFHICDVILRRSNAFRVLAINHVFNQWQRKYPFQYILSANRKLSKLINGKAKIDSLNMDEIVNSGIGGMVLDDPSLYQWLNFDYQRVYVPKPGTDDVRPIGVPKYEWRLLLHMYSNFLTF